MQYRTLGRTGIKVSPYALGTLMLATSVGNPDPDDSARIIHKVLDAGINLVDTADAYGDSEEVVGRALKGRRDTVVLATKVSRPMGDDPNQQGASRRWIMTAVENSLRRLQTDHPRRPRPTSSRPSGSPSGVAWNGSAPSNRPTRCSTAASNARYCRLRSAMGWARWCGARSGRGCSPAASARAAGPTSAAPPSSRSSATSTGSTPSVPPGVDVGTLDQAYVPPALQSASLRRRPVGERGAG